MRVGDLHHQADYVAGRVELPALLARRVGEVADQVLVRSTEQVGELKVLLTERHLVEVHDQLAQLLVGHRRLADLAVEVDVLQDPVERPVAVFQLLQRLVQAAPDRLVEMITDLLPARPLRHVERLVERRRLGALLGLGLAAAP